MSTARMPSLRVQAYENFREQIVRAQIRPGQFISQRELMQLLGMPLGAVRELIPRLEAEGLLQTVPQRGLQVAQVDVKLIKNAFELRLLLERESAIRFAQEASHAELWQNEAAHPPLVPGQRTPTNQHAHPALPPINSLRVRLIKFENSSLSADILLAAMEEHLWFIEALRRRDATAVAERLGHHIESARRRVLGLPRPTLPWSSQTTTTT